MRFCIAAKHSANLDAFGHAFLGAHGPPGAVQKYFTGVAKGVVTDHVLDAMKFHDYVSAEFIGRVHYTGDPLSYYVEHGMDKLPPGTAEELAWQYSEQGAALGAIYPHMIRQMFGRTHAAVPDKKRAEARSAGLNIPPEQDLMSYEETEEEENEAFMHYCRECCPGLYSVLNK